MVACQQSQRLELQRPNSLRHSTLQSFTSPLESISYTSVASKVREWLPALRTSISNTNYEPRSWLGVFPKATARSSYSLYRSLSHPARTPLGGGVFITRPQPAARQMSDAESDEDGAVPPPRVAAPLQLRGTLPTSPPFPDQQKPVQRSSSQTNGASHA